MPLGFFTISSAPELLDKSDMVSNVAVIVSPLVIPKIAVPSGAPLTPREATVPLQYQFYLL